MGRDKVSAKERVREYGKDKLYEDHGVLFCTTCSISLHTKKYVIERHFLTQKHIDLKRQRDKAEDSDQPPAKLQKQVRMLIYKGTHVL